MAVPKHICFGTCLGGVTGFFLKVLAAAHRNFR